MNLDELEATREMVEIHVRSLMAGRGTVEDFAEIVQDITQHAFLKAIEAQDRFIPGANLQKWVCAIARNLCLDILRGKRSAYKASAYLADSPIDFPSPPGIEAPEILVSDCLSVYVHLSPERKRLALLYLAGLPPETILETATYERPHRPRRIPSPRTGSARTGTLANLVADAARRACGETL